MTYLEINNTQNGTIIFRDENLHTVWYELIRLIGLPLDTNGKLVDSIAKLKANQAGNGIACFTECPENGDSYRTNKVWYMIATK